MCKSEIWITAEGYAVTFAETLILKLGVFPKPWVSGLVQRTIGRAIQAAWGIRRAGRSGIG
jgi:hypothetical protein